MQSIAYERKRRLTDYCFIKHDMKNPEYFRFFVDIFIDDFQRSAFFSSIIISPSLTVTTRPH